MKLASLYSNLEEMFPRLVFRDDFNVIFAQVRDPGNLQKDSHNLGKTFLIQVIEFCLLKEIEREHPFRKRADLFDDFTFYLEIRTHSGSFVTVRRKVKGPRSVSIQVTEKKNEDLRQLPDDDWLHASLSLEKAKDILNDLLGLAVIAPYPYRKGVGYFLRAQNDYDDVFRIARFAAGKDRDWKPFMALLLGFNHKLVLKRYDLEAAKEKARVRLDEAESEAAAASHEYDQLRAIISVKKSDLERQRELVNGFSFREVESSISETLVADIEAEISKLNERKYVIGIELAEIERALESQFEFDLKKLNRLFQEVSLALPESLIRSYEELVDFNRRLTTARTERLRTVREHRLTEENSIRERLNELDAARKKALAALREKETLEKFRLLQARLIEAEREVAGLEQRLALLDRASLYRRDIQKYNTEIARVAEEIREAVHSGNRRLESIRTRFNAYVSAVFQLNALLFVQPNQEGNLEFRVRTLAQGKTEQETFEGEGTSYKKMLCACFDLALLSEYSAEPFYHFVYHDGIFESLDDRKKVTLIQLIRRVCLESGIQYILTVIDSDLPRDPDRHNLLFDMDEVVRSLHDGGKDGRLFRMPTF